MTGLWIATRDGVIANPESGEKFRIVKGRTLGDPRHPAVAAYPENWHPLDIELTVDDPDPDAEGEATQLAGELHDARNEADGYREQLAAIAQLVADRGLVDRFGVQPDHEGWLVELLGLALDNPGEPEDEPAEQVDGDEPVAAPRTTRKPRAPRKVTDDAAS